MLYRVKTHVNNEYSIYAILSEFKSFREENVMDVSIRKLDYFLLVLMDNCNILNFNLKGQSNQLYRSSHDFLVYYA